LNGREIRYNIAKAVIDPACPAFRRALEIAGGVTLIAMGLYMLNAILLWIPTLAM
jgi:hypothetical protein